MQGLAQAASIGHRYTSVYATPDGETHLRAVDARLEPTDFAPPARPLLVTKPWPAISSFFLAVPCQWGEADLESGLRHPAPARLICTVLRGNVMTYVSDGTVVRARPGETLLLEDVAPAKGHITVNPSTKHQCLLHMVQLATDSGSTETERGRRL